MPRGASRPGSSANTPTTDSSAVRLNLLGSACWSRGSARAVPLERRDAAVLAYLAIEGRAPRARLIELLWPDAAGNVGRNHFRQRLYRLNKAAGTVVVEGGEMLSLNRSIRVDACDLAPSAAAGELLPGLDYTDFPQFDGWLMQQRARLRRAHVDSLAAEASRLEGEGNVADAIAIAERLIALAPLEEHAHRRLMHLHYLRGDRSAAIAAFERFERLVKDELGVRPSAETLALLDTIEHSANVVPVGPAGTVPSSIARPPRMIARERQAAAVGEALRAGRVALVLGAGGLGKSRLLTELALQFDRAVLVRARPGDATVPYALLTRWLRVLEERDSALLEAARPHVLGALLPDRGSSPAERRVTTAALRFACEQVLSAALARGLAACLLDDLHWADAASLELLQHLMLAEHLVACGWVLSQRPEQDNAAANALAGALGDAHRVVTVRLTALDTAAIGELVDSLALPKVDAKRLAGPLAQHTGGNPLFVLETLKEAFVRGGFDGQRLPRPAGVMETIERRLSALSGAAQSLVQIAAVAGEDFSVELAAAVLGTSAVALAEPWRELESAQLIDGDAFVHDLVHEAAFGWVPQPIRRHLHGAVARFLAVRHGDAARIADLWLAAGDDEHAAPALVAAADAARRAGRFIEAGQRCEQAARAYDRLRDEANAFEQLYRAFDDLSTKTSHTVYEPIAVELEQRARGDVQRAMAAMARAQLANLAGDWDVMEHALHDGLVAARRCGDRTLEAEATFGLGVLSHSRGELVEAVEQLTASALLLDAPAARLRQAEVRGSLARVLYLVGRIGDASAELDKAIPALREGNVHNELAADIGFRALLSLEAGELAAALDYSRRSCSLLDEVEAGPHEWLTAMGDRLRVLVTASWYDEALDLVRAVRTDRRFAPLPTQVRFIECEAAMLFELGRGWQAERLLEPLAATDGGVAGYRGSRALLALQGQRLRARAVASEHADTIRTLVSGVPQRCRYAALAGPHLPAPAALQLCGSALELAESLGLKAHLPGVLASHADALRRAQQPDEARRHAQRAVRLLESTTPLSYRGSIWLLLHDTLSAVGDSASARAVLLHASEWVHRTARTSVPPAFRDSFLGRNAVNRELLLRALRADMTPAG